MPPQIHQKIIPFVGDAFQVFNIFKDQPQVFFLDSSLRQPQAQFSYIGFSPFTTVRDANLARVKKVFDKHLIPRRKESFPAGAVGYLGYDGTVYFGFYDTIIAVDHQHQQIIISSLKRERIKTIELKIKILIKDTLSLPNELTRNPKKNSLNFKSNFTKTAYIKAIRQALRHIHRGDIYQINLSHQIILQKHGRKWASLIYHHLRQFFPSPFGAYVDDGKQVILSASPERFLRLKNRIVQVKPMKGTRTRGFDKKQDKELKDELIKSPKEIAELLMVTDLERNDLGKVCEIGSVRVKEMRSIETYASVFQATSTIEGKLRGDCDPFDLLQAAFPSGSVTGCPKIESMKIIKELEHGPRGLYTGALGYISFSGDMDFNVMIRTMFINENKITFHVGGGIVADSNPQDEWQETWDKAKPLIETLKKVFE